MSGIVRPNNTGQSGIVANVETIDSDDYIDGSIDNAHLADDAVDSDELAAGAVDTAHIGNLQVTTAKIAGDAINGTKLADDAVDSEHYTDGSIDTAHIADNAVTLAKMDGITRGSIIIGDSNGDPAALGIGSNTYVLTSDATDISWAAAAGGPTEATKSDMEAEATGTIYVPPDLVKNSPGVAKCWINIHGTDTFAVEQSYNCDGATDESTGTYEVTVTTNFAGANNNCIVCGGHDGVTSDPRFNVGVTGANLTVGTFRIIGMLEDGTTGISAVADGTDIMAAVFGDQ